MGVAPFPPATDGPPVPGSAAQPVHAAGPGGSPLVFGVPEFDRRMGAGLLPGRTVLLEGPVGTGKTTLAAQFLAQGARSGERGLMILTDAVPGEFLANMKPMGFGFEDARRAGAVQVMELTEDLIQLKSQVRAGKIDVRKFATRLLTDLGKAIRSGGVRRVVVDPVTPLQLGDEEYARTMFLALPSLNVRTLLTSATLGTKGSRFELGSSYVSGIVQLSSELREGRIHREFRVLKMRGTYVEPTAVGYDITAQGLVPNPLPPDAPPSSR